jgi:hypothetical protein
LGRPAKPEDYKFDEPKDLHPGLQGKTEMDAQFRTWAYKFNLDPATANALRQEYRVMESKAMAQFEAQKAQEQDAAIKALQDKWGDKLGQNNELGKKFVLKAGGQEMLDQLGKLGLGDNPVVLDLFYRCGKMFSEEAIANFGFSTLEGGAAEAQQKYAEYKKAISTRDKSHPINSENAQIRGEAVKHMEAVQRMILENGGSL